MKIDEITFLIAFLAYFSAAFSYFYVIFWSGRIPGKFPTALLICGILSHFIAILSRAAIAGYAPMSNMFESLSVYSWLIAISYVFLECKYKIKTLGPFIISISFTMIAIASVLPQDIKPLVPALQSRWLALHVLVTFAGEAAFAISYAASLFYIIKPDAGPKSENIGQKAAGAGHVFFVVLNIGLFASVISYFITALLIKRQIISGSEWFMYVPILTFFIFSTAFYFIKNMVISVLPPAAILEDIAYRSIAFGLPVFTLGALIFGAIWAHRTWGSYWSWDPKETWALITWFIYAAYLHARHNSSLRGRAAAYLTAIGFISTLFTYFGVNYLLSGLHSYGRF